MLALGRRIGFTDAARDEQHGRKGKRAVHRHDDKQWSIAAQEIEQAAVERIPNRPAQRAGDTVERNEACGPGRPRVSGFDESRRKG
jgi:hypothetical protein